METWTQVPGGIGDAGSIPAVIIHIYDTHARVEKLMDLATRIPVLAELERLGYEYEYLGDDEIKGLCPFHEDRTPSCGINVAKGRFKCFACGKSGDIITLMAGMMKVNRDTIIADLAKRHDLENVKVIELDVVEQYHQALWYAPPLLDELRKRGVTDEDIRKYRLGEDKGRVTIPVKNAYGDCVNIRRYMPGAPGPDKMRNTKGRGKPPRAYPVEQLAYQTVMVTGGEIKAIVGARILNAHDVGCVSCTGGEHNWPQIFIETLRGKKIYVCMDVDSAGTTSARELCLRLLGVATWIGLVRLPLNLDKYPHGDVNDFVAQDGGDLFAVVNETPQWEPEFTVPVWGDGSELDEKPTRVELSYTVRPDYAHRRVKFSAMVAASGRVPYTIPRKVRVTCDRSQRVCPLCPVFSAPVPTDGKGYVEAEIRRESDAVLELVNVTRKSLSTGLKRAFSIPEECPIVKFEPETFYSAEIVRLNPSLDIANRDTERSMLAAVAVGCPATLNESYVFTGRPHPHPGTQESTLVLGKSKPIADSLDTYEPRRLDELELFRPSAWTTIAVTKKLDELYADVETNVTQIFQRREMHLLIDLAYHSPLLIKFDGARAKGWVEVLIVGDSAQGKTETATRLMDHYGLGAKVECKNATVAGLLGGVAKFGDAWMVTWGVIPLHDQRLVILEELKGASVGTISRLTDMRSSGVAELPKIEKRRTHARTRLVALSNARGDRPVDSYGFGIETVSELIGNPEDVRRFDAALVLSSKDVDVRTMNVARESRSKVLHQHTGELCRELILWAWTRKESQVLYDDGARSAVLSEAVRLGDIYTDRVPLIDRGSTRYKLARLSAALAARTFSTENGHDLLVRECHVRYVSEFLDRKYSDSTHGYGRLSETMRRASTITESPIVKEQLLATPFPRDLCENLLYCDVITSNDMQDWTSYDRFEAGRILSVLVRKRALVKHDRGTYRKNADFVRLLREITANGVVHQEPEKPQEEKF